MASRSASLRRTKSSKKNTNPFSTQPPVVVYRLTNAESQCVTKKRGSRFIIVPPPSDEDDESARANFEAYVSHTFKPSSRYFQMNPLLLSKLLESGVVDSYEKVILGSSDPLNTMITEYEDATPDDLTAIRFFKDEFYWDLRFYLEKKDSNTIEIRTHSQDKTATAEQVILMAQRFALALMEMGIQANASKALSVAKTLTSLNTAVRGNSARLSSLHKAYNVAEVRERMLSFLPGTTMRRNRNTFRRDPNATVLKTAYQRVIDSVLIPFRTRILTTAPTKTEPYSRFDSGYIIWG